MFRNKSILITLFLALSLVLSSCGIAGNVSFLPAPNGRVPDEVVSTTRPSIPTETQAQVTSVEIQTENAASGQINAIVHGNLTEACATLGKPQLSYKTQTFMILLPVVSPTDHGCLQSTTTFEQAIPLDIAGLPAGEYTVKVNGVSAVFSLSTGQSQAPIPADIGGGTGQANTYNSDLYHFQFNIPVGWTAAVDKNVPSGAGTDPEYITMTPGDNSGLPRLGVIVLTGIPPFTGYEKCEKNLIFRTLPACKISNPAGQNPATEMLIFQNGTAYYFITLQYDDPNSLHLFDDLLTSFEFTN